MFDKYGQAENTLKDISDRKILQAHIQRISDGPFFSVYGSWHAHPDAKDRSVLNDRISIQVLAQLDDLFPDGIWLHFSERLPDDIQAAIGGIQNRPAQLETAEIQSKDDARVRVYLDEGWLPASGRLLFVGFNDHPRIFKLLHEACHRRQRQTGDFTQPGT